MSDNEPVEIDVRLHKTHRQAWLVSKSGRERDGVWIPFSQATLAIAGMRATLTMKRGFAKMKGLL